MLYSHSKVRKHLGCWKKWKKKSVVKVLRAARLTPGGTGNTDEWLCIQCRSCMSFLLYAKNHWKFGGNVVKWSDLHLKKKYVLDGEWLWRNDGVTFIFWWQIIIASISILTVQRRDNLWCLMGCVFKVWRGKRSKMSLKFWSNHFKKNRHAYWAKAS